MPPKPLLFALAAILAIVAALLLLLQMGMAPSAPVAPPQTAPAVAEPEGEQTEQPLARSATAMGLVVRGRVVDADGEGVADALVGDIAGTAPVSAGADGRFDLRVVDAADATDELGLLVL